MRSIRWDTVRSAPTLAGAARTSAEGWLQPRNVDVDEEGRLQGGSWIASLRNGTAGQFPFPEVSASCIDDNRLVRGEQMKSSKTFPIVAALLVSIPLLAAGQSVGKNAAESGDAPQTREGSEQIYGSQMMTAEERAAYHSKMRAAKTDDERERLRDEHHRQMVTRAKERGITLPETPPMRPRAGSESGAGVGPGPGRGPGAGAGR